MSFYSLDSGHASFQDSEDDPSDSNLPSRVVNGISNSCCSGHPVLEDYQVYEVMKQRKITGGVVRDLHPTVVQKCMIELVHPVAVNKSYSWNLTMTLYAFNYNELVTVVFLNVY